MLSIKETFYFVLKELEFYFLTGKKRNNRNVPFTVPKYGNSTLVVTVVVNI